MEIDLKRAVGKSAGEIARDFAEFLAAPFLIAEKDLSVLENSFSLQEQFAFSLLKEAQMQGWSQTDAENFYLQICAEHIDRDISARVLASFRNPQSDFYKILENKYRAEFTLKDNTYWADCLSFGISKGEAGKVLKELQAFTVCIMEFAYMNGKIPEKTYVWGYYESFGKILEKLNQPDDVTLPLTIRSIGGSTEKKSEEKYLISLGVDLENPNKDKSACSIRLDITLKDAKSQVIEVIHDKIRHIDPASIFHYGITKSVLGNPVASISASAAVEHFFYTRKVEMKGLKLSEAVCKKSRIGQTLCGKLTNNDEKVFNGFAIYYQYLNADGKIVGGGNEWFFSKLDLHQSLPFTSEIELHTKPATKIVYSADFDLDMEK